jgi:hypothetical protein
MKIANLIPLILLLAACAPAPQSTMPRPVVPDLPGAEATYFAAVQEATATANAATVEAQREAQIATATADFVRFEHEATRQAQEARATDIALEATATINATNGRATAVAFEQSAIVSQRLIDDETARLHNQRQAEMLALQRQATINATIPFIIAAAAMIAIGGAALAGRVIWLHAQPTVISYPDQRAPTVMVHNPDGWRVLPAPRTVAPDRMLPPPVEDAPRPIQLPALTKGHVLIVGPTGNGKTVALREIIDHRQNVTVLDPHYTPGAWGDNARVIGGGSDYDAIIEYLHYMQQELIRRSQARANGRTNFEAMTFATEEMPAIVAHGGREVGTIWRFIMREGRKYGLEMVTVSQSKRVKTLGIEGEGDLLENFRHVLLLGKAAIEHCPEANGMTRPAVLLSGHNAPQPVIIPYDPRKDPESPQFAPRLLTQAQPPAADYAEPGMATEGGFVTRAEMDKMLSYERQGWSRRKISAELYGTEGGAAYQRVKGVLDALVGAVLPA